jgi:hypothetical protein
MSNTNTNNRNQDRNPNKKNFKRYSKEKVADIKRRNKNVINKINFWQSFQYVKSLTCRNTECDGVLEAKESGLKVVLKCPKCNYVQAYIPKTILNTKLDIPNILLKHQGHI